MDLQLEAIERYAHTLDPAFLHSPQYWERILGRDVLIKLETANPLRCFKGRGAEAFAETIERGRRVICASSGNFGSAMAYACGRRGIGIDVFVPRDANPVKVARIRKLGADVHVGGEEAARFHAESIPGGLFVEDGQEPAVAEGAGTIGVELLRAGPLDTVLVPVGDGALIAGIALWVKEHSPATQIIGVCAAGAPAMARSFRARRPISVPHTDTVADGLEIWTPVPQSVSRICALVDDMLEVEDGELFDGMRLAMRELGILLEPSGAAGLAALVHRDVPGERVACVLTGGNARPEQRAQLLAA